MFKRHVSDFESNIIFLKNGNNNSKLSSLKSNGKANPCVVSSPYLSVDKEDWIAQREALVYRR